MSYRDLLYGEAAGHDRARRLFERMYSEGHHHEWTMICVTGNPGCTIGEWTFSFTVSDAVPQGAGRTLRYQGISVFETRQGRCHTYREHFDRAATLLALGLLRPALVDPATGYRRYSVDQLRAASLIFQLRSVGASPGSIAQIVAGGLGASAGLIAQRRRIESEIAQRRRSLDHIDEFLHGGRAENYQIDMVELAPRQVPARPFVVPLGDLEAGLLRAIASLRSTLRRGGYRRSGAWGATFPLELTSEVNGDLQTARLPRMRAVRTVHHAGIGSLPLAYHAALEAIGGSATQPIIEEYLGLDDVAAPAGPIRVHVPYDLDKGFAHLASNL